mmetsp:Transcript_11911/g.19470  ORF Transcript_11911/g.19470 Transcript_11911/m.19470 type:complete len:228 (+) Transcript_11911:160-843(+)
MRVIISKIERPIPIPNHRPALAVTNRGIANIPAPFVEEAKKKVSPIPADVPNRKLPTGIHNGIKTSRRITTKSSITGPNGYNESTSTRANLLLFLLFANFMMKYGKATGMPKNIHGRRIRESIGTAIIPLITAFLHLSTCATPIPMGETFPSLLLATIVVLVAVFVVKLGLRDIFPSPLFATNASSSFPFPLNSNICCFFPPYRFPPPPFPSSLSILFSIPSADGIF